MSKLQPLEIDLLNEAIDLGYARPESDYEARVAAGLASQGYLTDRGLSITDKGRAALKGARS